MLNCHVSVSVLTLALLASCFSCQFQMARAADQPPHRLAWSRSVQLPELTGESLATAPFDAAIYAATQNHFQDVRLYSAAGSEVAFIVRHSLGTTTVQEKQTWSPAEIKLQPIDNNALVIIFSIDPQVNPQWPAGIRLDSPLQNFQHHVHLETSVDGHSWQKIADDLIFDYSQFMSVRDTEITLPLRSEREAQNAPTFYRLTIDEATQEQESQLMELSRSLQGGAERDRSERVTINRQPFRIDRIELWQDEASREVATPLEVKYDLTVDRVEANEATKETYVYVISQREPLTDLHVTAKDRNFSRPCRVEYRDSLTNNGQQANDSNWIPLAVNQLVHIAFQSIKVEQLQVSFPETRATEYRLVIDNRDSPPLTISGMSGVGPRYEAVFLADPAVSYSLGYGSETLETAHYDTAAIDILLREGYVPQTAQLGTANRQTTALEPQALRWTKLLSNGPVMTVVIGGLVVVLGLGLYRAAARLETR